MDNTSFGIRVQVETDYLDHQSDPAANRYVFAYTITISNTGEQPARLINRHFSQEEKNHIVELLWEVAYADGELDKYEEHLVRKLADLIYVPHRSFIRAKHRAKARLGAEDR